MIQYRTQMPLRPFTHWTQPLLFASCVDFRHLIILVSDSDPGSLVSPGDIEHPVKAVCYHYSVVYTQQYRKSHSLLLF